MSIKTTLKTSVAAAALFAVSAPVISSPAEAGMANGNDNGVVISGSINRAMQYVDNGNSNAWHNVDGGTDGSRLRILVNGQLTESVKVGGTWEADLPTSSDHGKTSSTEANAQGSTSTTSSAFNVRHVNVTFSHATLGKFSIGQGNVASNNLKSLGKTSKSETGLSSGGAMLLFDKTALTQTTLSAGGQFASYFGTRADRIRYDTPSLMGFAAAISMGDSGRSDATITYGATYGDVTVAAGVHGTHTGSASPTENIGGSVAAKHTSGLSIGAHYGQENGTSNNAGTTVNIEGSAWGAEVGFTTSAMSSLGATSFEVKYVESDEATVDLMEAEAVGFTINQDLPAGVNLYGMYKVASFDDGAASTAIDDVTVFMVGTRIKF